jgi:hypothetical protein
VQNHKGLTDEELKQRIAVLQAEFDKLSNKKEDDFEGEERSVDTNHPAILGKKQASKERNRCLDELASLHSPRILERTYRQDFSKEIASE